MQRVSNIHKNREEDLMFSFRVLLLFFYFVLISKANLFVLKVFDKDENGFIPEDELRFG